LVTTKLDSGWVVGGGAPTTQSVNSLTLHNGKHKATLNKHVGPNKRFEYGEYDYE